MIRKKLLNPLNLQATPNIILFDVPFGVGNFKQIIGRVCREFSDFKEFKIYFIVARGTVDEYKAALIESNKAFFTKVFDELNLPGDVNISISSYVIDELKKQLLWRR